MAKSRKDKKSGKKKEKRIVPHALAHIQATFNNTLISITDVEGNTLGWSSSGKIGFKGSRKGTPFAAQVAGKDAGIVARDLGVRTVDVLVKGPGGGRESAIRALQATGIVVKSIKDVTPIPHNG
ncbi:MAG: 30S ribosomal protein S11, partial [bacterium]|nr:30S ribosomal protein S11 [bacterium]